MDEGDHSLVVRKAKGDQESALAKAADAIAAFVRKNAAV